MEEHTMKSRDRFSFAGFAVTLAALALLTVAASAGAAEPGWQLKFGGAWVSPALHDTIVNPEGDRFTIDSDTAIGLSVALERRFSDHLGLEFGALRVTPDVNLRITSSSGATGEVSDGLAYTPFTVGLNVYVVSGGSTEVFLTPALAYVMYGDLSFSVGGDTLKVAVDNDLTWGLGLGTNLRLGGGRWWFSGVVSYLGTALKATDVDGGGSQSFDYNPFTVTVGLGYRF
jgi:outer membrane protein W